MATARPLAVPLDARFTHRGTYSSWLLKAKGDCAKAKWLSANCRRYFTIDFDKQVLFYSHSESGKEASPPIAFSDIVNAEQGAEERLFCPAARNSTAAPRPSAGRGPAPPPPSLLGMAPAAPLQSLAARLSAVVGGGEDSAPHGGGLRRSLSLTSMMPRRSQGGAGEFPLILITRQRRIRLLAERESDAHEWVDLLNAASRIGQGLATEHRPAARGDARWPPDYSLVPPSLLTDLTGNCATNASRPVPTWISDKQEPSEKCSQEASTAENASDCGSASPASSCAGEYSGGGLLKEQSPREDTESTICSAGGPDGSTGAPSPCSARGRPPACAWEEATEEAATPAAAGGEASAFAPPAASREAKPWEAPPIAPRRLQATDFGFDDEDGSDPTDREEEEEEEEEEPMPVAASPSRSATWATRAPGTPQVLLATDADQRYGATASAAPANATVIATAAEEFDGGDGSDDESPAHSSAQRASRVATDLQLVAQALAAGQRSGGCAVAAGGGEKEKRKKSKASKHAEPRTAEVEVAGRIAADLMLVQRAKAQAAAAQRHGARAARARGSSLPAGQAVRAS